MEFSIDFELVRKLAKAEYQQARSELASQGVMQAFRNSLARHDEQLSRAADQPSLACRQGCAWCCHFSIDIRPVEAFNIIEFLRKHYPARIGQIQQELAANHALLQHLDEEQRMLLNIKCPFLAEGACSIYPVRPQTCRNYHATDAAGCKQSFEQPENMDIAPEFAPVTFQTGAAQVDAFAKAMQDEGFVVDVYEMNSALLEVLNDSDNTWRCFINKVSPFSASGSDIALEFAEVKE